MMEILFEKLVIPENEYIRCINGNPVISDRERLCIFLQHIGSRKYHKYDQFNLVVKSKELHVLIDYDGLNKEESGQLYGKPYETVPASIIKIVDIFKEEDISQICFIFYVSAFFTSGIHSFSMLQRIHEVTKKFNIKFIEMSGDNYEGYSIKPLNFDYFYESEKEFFKWRDIQYSKQRRKSSYSDTINYEQLIMNALQNGDAEPYGF